MATWIHAHLDRLTLFDARWVVERLSTPAFRTRLSLDGIDPARLVAEARTKIKQEAASS
ncbi:hypothetical protein [Methylobrevis pamukkalensis]|uniref:hypothetical protein n=1 Tax=Methylobrevis pamukkalensis TaxID=1439726 RepID=UPI0014712E97|nr:hypothetical protein [Methylobrevis pamukkalensis]